jgi:hypothetical protein
MKGWAPGLEKLYGFLCVKVEPGSGKAIPDPTHRMFRIHDTEIIIVGGYCRKLVVLWKVVKKNAKDDKTKEVVVIFCCKKSHITDDPCMKGL